MRHLPLLFLFFLAACKETPAPEATVIRKDITETIFASGSLDAQHIYNITAQTEGYISKLTISEGDIVAKGKLIAVIDNPQNAIATQKSKELLGIAQSNAQTNAPLLQQTLANIAIAKNKLAQDEVQYQRFKALFQSNSVTKLEYENTQLAFSNSQANLQALQQQYESLKIQANQQVVAQQQQVALNEVSSGNSLLKAVQGGKVYKKLKQLGDYVRRGDAIATIGDIDNLYAKLSIDESNMSKLKLGQEALIQLNTDKTKTYKAKIDEIMPTFDQNTQSFLVKAKFIDKLDFSIVGTQLQANVIAGNRKNVLLIPRNFMDYGNKITLKDKKIIAIKTGFVSGEWVEVVDGLNEGDVIVQNMKK
jgi:multidrug efflux pump subunit AcrA (membrane-fusion protein)